MTIKVTSDGPVVTRKTLCVNCAYELSFNNIDLVRHRTDSDGDAIEPKGKYLVCPRPCCNFRNIIEREG